MRLFYQLNQEEQHDVLHHCADIVIQDILTDGVHLDPITEEEIKLKEYIDDAVKHTQMLESKDEKAEYLMSDALISKTIYDIALEMAKGAFYHDEEEIVIFPASLHNEDEELMPEKLLESQTKKKVSSLN
jgi:hypothetical protein